MFLKFNINDIKHESREIKVSKIEVNEVDERTVYVTFTTDLPHRLAIGDKLRLESAALTAATYTIAEEMAKTNEGALIFVENAAASNKPSYYLVSYGFLNALDDFDVNNLLTYSVSLPDDNIKVIDYNYNDTTFSIEIVTVQKVDVKDVLDGTSSNSVVHLSKPISMFFKRGDALILKRKIWSYKPIIIDDASDLRYQVVTDIPTDYNGYDYIKNSNVDDNIFYKWSLHYESIECKFIHGKYIEAPIGVVFPNDEYEILDTRFIKNKVFRSDIKVYELVETLNISLPISSDNDINLDKENLAQHLFKEKREELIPQINDYEKRCFTPYFKNTSDNSIEPISTIKFNLFLRDRSGSDNWTTDDTKGWNQYKFDGDKFTWEVYKTEGDLLGFLNFTDDDVYYRKKNISKSFYDYLSMIVLTP